MNAGDLVMGASAVIRLGDSQKDVERIMNDYKVEHLPVGKDDDSFVGYISDEASDANVGELGLIHPEAFVETDTYLLKVWHTMAKYNLSCIAVVDKTTFKLVGSITQSEILNYFSHIFPLAEEGPIIIFRTRRIDYRLSEISRIVEEFKAKIIFLFVSPEEQMGRIWVTMKVDLAEIDGIIHGLDRHGYEVIQISKEGESPSKYQDNYESLMKYLNI